MPRRARSWSSPTSTRCAPTCSSAAIAEGRAPTFGALLERGVLVPDCVSSFPSVTPVACAEMVTGVGADRHWISGMNWYHRLERRYVEYGSSLEATRAFGVFRALYDLVYNMNLAHLSPEIETLFEQPRRRRRAHRLHAVPDLPRPPPPPGLARRAAAPRGRRDPAEVPPPHLGPDRALLRRPLRQPRGALQVDLDPRQSATATPPAARPSWSRRTASTSSSSRCPTTTTTRTATGPRRASSRSPRPTTASRKLVEAAGGLDAFLAEHAVILVADHAQTAVHRGLPLAELLGREWSVLQPSDDRPELAQLAVSPTGRAAHVYLLPGEGERAEPAAVAARLAEIEGVDLVCRLRGRRRARRCAATSRGCRAAGGEWAVVERGGERLRFRPGERRSPTCAAGAGSSRASSAALEATVEDGRLRSDDLPRPAGPGLVGADRAARRRLRRLARARLRGGRLGRRQPRRRRQPRLAARRRLASARCSSSAAARSRPTSASSGPCATSRRSIREHFGLRRGRERGCGARRRCSLAGPRRCAARSPRRCRDADAPPPDDHRSRSDRGRRPRPEGRARSERENGGLTPSANKVERPLGGRLLRRRQGGARWSSSTRRAAR